MSLLAAAVPVAVLVLAWDETTPAVRALVEASETAAPAFDSVVVLVPAAAGELSQEEFLPIAPETTISVDSSSEEPVVTEEAEAAAETAPPSAPLPLLVVAPAEPAPAAPLAPADEPEPRLGIPKISAASALAPPTWSAVRVLRLSSFSLPELTALSHQALPRPIWQSSVVAPAAPYLGSQIEAEDSATHTVAAPVATQPGVAAHPNSTTGSGAPLAPTLPAAEQPEQPLPPLPVSALTYVVDEASLPALDAEADLAPVSLDELATGEAAPTAAPLAEAADDAHSDWSDALASLSDPLPFEENSGATANFEDEAAYYAATTGEPTPTGTEPAALRAPQPFESPNLNFQVIQYARFAVPLALAQTPFTAIYAPAWPTWLAAQELRYRTRQPLVLHVATLAASEEDSISTATGWQAELQRQALQGADLILAETPALAHRLRRDLGLPLDLVRTVPAADAAAVAQALRTAQLRPTVNRG